MSSKIPKNLEIMDESTYDWFYQNGCAPTCHICLSSIGIGDYYDMRVILSTSEEDSMAGDGTTRSVTMMTCSNCINKPTPDADLLKARGYLSRKKVLRKKRQKEAAKSGCLVVDARVVAGIGGSSQ